jgi:hypothetical protein
MFGDARWGDPRDRAHDPFDRPLTDDWDEPGRHTTDHDRDRQDDSPQVGRGPADDRDSNASRERPDGRWPDRNRAGRQRARDPRDIFVRHVYLPSRNERELVTDSRGRAYALRRSESRTLATVGAFRVVPSSDLGGHSRAASTMNADLRQLREQKLVETVRIPGQRSVALTLTDRGLDLLESRRNERAERPQMFCAGVNRERELEHDSQLYAAFLEAAQRLGERDADIERVVLDEDLKREYQRWLHARDRERDDYDGHPDRTEAEIQDWATDHDLPYFDGQIHFPDVRIEFQDADGRLDHDDVEVVTAHYRGAHGGAVARSGFTSYRVSSARIGGRGRSGGGTAHRGGLAEELWD